MLSGVSTQEEAVSLRDRLSTGGAHPNFEDPAANCRRIHPGWKKPVGWGAVLNSPLRTGLKLSLEPEAINARLTRLEEALASGARLHQAAPQAPEEEGPPCPTIGKPPEISEEEAVPQDAPVGFWTDLAARVRGELVPPVSGFFTSTPDAPVQGALRNGCLELQCVNSFVHDTVNKPEILQRIAQCASGMLGHPVRVLAVDLQAKPKTGENLQALLEFGKKHSDIMKVKN